MKYVTKHEKTTQNTPVYIIVCKLHTYVRCPIESYISESYEM